MEDGTVLTASFPVAWETPEGGYNAEGIVSVKGTADVFGEKMPVSASVRVQEAEYSVGDNIAKEAMTLKQDIPQEMQSDDLEAIRDGNRTVDGNQGGNTNSTMWSNYKNSKDAKDNDADITFQYATQQIFNQIKIFFSNFTGLLGDIDLLRIFRQAGPGVGYFLGNLIACIIHRIFLTA